jgi:ABC-type branched-subunit amino acid transport system substrate-binding protein
MANINRLIVIIRFLLLTALVAVCPHSATASVESSVEIAVIVARSGKAEAYGRAAVRGAQVAADEINRAGGVLNHRIELVVLDNQSSPLHARKAALTAVDR